MDAATLVGQVASLVREEAAARKWNQSELARRAGLSQGTARRYFFAEDRDMSVAALVAAATAFDVPVSELLARAEARAGARGGGAVITAAEKARLHALVDQLGATIIEPGAERWG